MADSELPTKSEQQSTTTSITASSVTRVLFGAAFTVSIATSFSAVNEYTRLDLDNIAALLSKDQAHQKCKEINCYDKLARVTAIMNEIFRIPSDVFKPIRN